MSLCVLEIYSGYGVILDMDAHLNDCRHDSLVNVTHVSRSYDSYITVRLKWLVPHDSKGWEYAHGYWNINSPTNNHIKRYNVSCTHRYFLSQLYPWFNCIPDSYSWVRVTWHFPTLMWYHMSALHSCLECLLIHALAPSLKLRLS